MKKAVFLIIAILSLENFVAQQKKFKCEKVYDAVKLIDEEHYDEAITVLQDCEKIDPEEYTYPYEIALAHTYKKDYEKAVNQLLKIKNYKNIGADWYQLLGNNYDYLGKAETAISTYDEGLKKFPKSGKLYLERGVVYEFEEKYDDAMISYEKGMRVDPNYPSNYYRAAKMYMNSQNTMKGLIYGEIFVNLERTTNRTKDLNKMLFDTYKSSVKFEGKDKKQVAICKSTTINITQLESKKLPFCMIFEKNFLLSVIDQDHFSLESFAKIRQKFLKEYFFKDSKDYPNLLMDYLKKMEDQNIFNAYNHYVFQMGDEEGFNTWEASHAEEFEKFVDWYSNKENGLNLNEKGVFITDQIN
ncbi:hypothetical protein [Chryseobacterium sp.]|uniref:tetratricopeptide repeat protein n=1 Tax=Chryseobacterium sp. TaxID=1871047 RepID=UPI002898148B|nr:hypothetical protein [Chryseobacterium sp.]